MRARAIVLAATAALGLGALGGCTSAPVTGRNQLIMTSEAEEAQMGVEAFQEVTAGSRLSTNAAWTQMVQNSGRRIAAVANRPDFQWEFRLIAEDTVNAFCLPGGKVAFYEGIMPVCRDEAGVAVVMGHEVGHAIARHGGERVTQTMIAQNGVAIIAEIISGKSPELARAAAPALGAGVQVGALLPFSRKHESEADEIGLFLMADAGYDPREAPRFWERMVQATGGERSWEFLSTHPDPQNRIKRLNELMPEAMTHYEAARAGKPPPTRKR
ncbi:MAG TPA: M48 family metallopeptidase [Planctomycetota bacterium]|nr:M48 family metallopeptidase [Planctomycetota bacterium]